MSVEPTCTKEGKATYTVTYTDVDKFSNPTTNVTDTKNIKESVVKALGHKYTLSVEWAADHKTAAKATLVCSQCAEGEEGHTVDVTASVTYDLKTDPVSGEATQNQAIYHAGEKDEVKSEIWVNHSEHTWKFDGFTWASDLKSATGTFTCTVGKEKKDAVVTMSSIPHGKDPASVVTEWTATVSTDPDGKAITPIKEAKYVRADGTETTREEWIKALGEGIAIEGLEEEYKFAGTAIKPAFTVVDNSLGITLSQGVDYSVSYKDNTKVGTATITVNGKGNYTGKTVTAQFKIVSPTADITSGLVSKVTKIEKVDYKPTYTGQPMAPEKITVVAEGESIGYEWNGSEYQKTSDTTKEVGISIVNNVNAGTATIAAVGADGKAKKATFKIAKVDLKAIAADQLEITVQDEVDYAVKGAVPEVTVTYTPADGSPVTLVNGQDFKATYKYANKKNVGEGNIVYITGKGTNFTKKREATDKFKIVKHELKDSDIVSVEAYAGQKAKAVKVIVKDSAGVTIPVKQYEVHVFTDEGLEVSADSKAKLEEGKDYKVEIKAKEGGNLEGDADVTVTARANLGKAKVTLSDTLKKGGVAYTGEPIDLENYQSGDLIINYFESGITVELNKQKLVYGTDYEVAGYQNNVNKGSMIVYIRGIGDKCSGTKAIKVKIVPKTMKQEK
jgi:hypothetical protein